MESEREAMKMMMRQISRSESIRRTLKKKRTKKEKVSEVFQTSLCMNMILRMFEKVSIATPKATPPYISIHSASSCSFARFLL